MQRVCQGFVGVLTALERWPADLPIHAYLILLAVILLLPSLAFIGYLLSRREACARARSFGCERPQARGGAQRLPGLFRASKKLNECQSTSPVALTAATPGARA